MTKPLINHLILKIITGRRFFAFNCREFKYEAQHPDFFVTR